jgi:hypothetical protein
LVVKHDVIVGMSVGQCVTWEILRLGWRCIVIYGPTKSSKKPLNIVCFDPKATFHILWFCIKYLGLNKKIKSIVLVNGGIVGKLMNIQVSYVISCASKLYF